tara:strand:+ start:511 stop:768 length:258 start_codon:yes stop_codon:yes gene_type:complete
LEQDQNRKYHRSQSVGDTMNEVYVLQIRHSGEEDEVFLYRQLRDAKEKVFEYFGEKLYDESLEDLEQRYFDQDKGYFSIYTTTIQ